MIIYILCPSHLITGGPDALHQLAFYLRETKLNAKLVYVDLKKKNYIIPLPYHHYINEYFLVSDIVDAPDNVLIIPETLAFFKDNYKYIRKYIWWLSVDNNISRSSFLDKLRVIFSKLRIGYLRKFIKKKNKLLNLKYLFKQKKYDFIHEDLNIRHLCASYYAYDFVSKQTKNSVELLIEPISLHFLSAIKFYEFNNSRNNIILYNPAKNEKFTKLLIKMRMPYKFVALSGYNQDQLIELYKSAKLYIDFGFFPGAERMPKEAVIFGCCILTGKYGASAFHGDVPINDKYKIDATVENIEKISNMIEFIIKNYEIVVDDFGEYRDRVLGLEESFISQLNKIFKED